jgi:hypothetical protein
VAGHLLAIDPEFVKAQARLGSGSQVPRLILSETQFPASVLKVSQLPLSTHDSLICVVARAKQEMADFVSHRKAEELFRGKRRGNSSDAAITNIGHRCKLSMVRNNGIAQSTPTYVGRVSSKLGNQIKD